MIRTRKNLNQLKTNPNNPRVIKDDKFKKLVKSLKEFPEMIEAREIVVNKDLVILGGNMRYRAAKEAGILEVPVKIVDWGEEKQREFIIKDNLSGGDWGLDLPIILDEKEVVEDNPPALNMEEPAISELGKTYRLGNHLLYCGSFEEIDRLFESPAVACVTDPPCGIGYIGGNSCRRKKIANDKMSDGDFKIFLDKIARSIAKNVRGGVMAFMSPLKLDDLRSALESSGLTWRSYIIWVKNTFTLGGSDFQHQFEPVLYHVNDGKYESEDGDEDISDIAIYGDINSRREWHGGRSQSDVWFFKRPTASKEHPTMKPIGLCAKAILSITKAKDLVYDPFLGSGSTLIACEQTDRKCIGSELDPHYCDVIRKRWWKLVNNSKEGWEDGTPETK